MKMTILDRILLLGAGLIAAYEIVVGIDGLSLVPEIAYSAAFGVLLVAGLLLIILGFEVLNSPAVVIISTIIPLSLAAGLVWQHLPQVRIAYLIFTILGFLAVLATRVKPLPNRLPVIVLMFVHGIAGLTIFGLPIFLVISGAAMAGFLLISLGGALIGVEGILLTMLKTGRPLLSQKTILRILPGLLLLTTAAFAAGNALA
ncbi:MAG: hypothetical protein ABFD24_03415 [Anaerolineaceae bacterium]|jgi:hypothetical protein